MISATCYLSSYNKGRCSVTQPIMWLG